MVTGYVADRWARNAKSVRMQYFGLGLYIVAEAFLMVPLLFVAAYATDGNVLPTALLITGVVFGGLTAFVLVTKKDFSFLGRALMIGMFAAGGLILASIIFGFTLGTFFSFAMVVLSAATSSITPPRCSASTRSAATSLPPWPSSPPSP